LYREKTRIFHEKQPQSVMATKRKAGVKKRATRSSPKAVSKRAGSKRAAPRSKKTPQKKALKKHPPKKGRARTPKAAALRAVSAPATAVSRPAPIAVADDLARISTATTQILDAASNGIIAIDGDGKIRFANSAAGDLLNRDAGAMGGVSIERVFVFGGGHAKSGQALPLKALIKDGPHYLEQEAHLARSDGESFEAVYAVAPIRAGRETLGYVITFRDITEQRRSEAELRLAGAVFEHSPEGLIIADAKGRVTKTNPAYRRVTSQEESEIVGKPLTDLLNAGTQGVEDVLPFAADGEDAQWEQWCKSKTGRRYAARISVSAVRDSAGVVQQYVAIVSDVTQRKLDEEKIIYQANYDQLTGLPNRTLFMDRLTRRVLEGKRAKTSVGLMFIDLDGFKAINDTMGHDAGDVLLKATARRLEKSVREADMVARLGGDEFTVIMPLIDSFEAAAVVASRIIKSLTEPFDLGGREGRISASIGISLLPSQATSASQLLHNADVAMYHAKHQGKANYQLYSPELEESVQLKERVL